MNCEARKGFLTLSSCDNGAATACATCGRSFCPAHLAAPLFTTCLECAATADPDGTQQGDDEYDGVWASRYRSGYYSSTGYTPGYGRSSYYDNQDTSSFRDRSDDGSDDRDDDTRAGFGDS
jgi:hypothetical protein